MRFNAGAQAKMSRCLGLHARFIVP